MSAPLRLAVLLSGTGRTLDNLLAERDAGRLPVEVVCVLSSRDGVRGLERARETGIPSSVVPPADTPQAYGAALTDALLPHAPELVAMAGFLHLWHIDPCLDGRVMNVHPALLPAFGGRGFFGDRVHRAVLESGVKVTGCTVHFADNQYDHGPIILQRTVPVLEDDDSGDVAARVFREECVAYPEAIRLFASRRLRIEGRRVRVLPTP